ncbi:hypothetical protein DENIS_1224 [Desulfonema ishimotonii]|uniref:Uncharacterized protein n=1 Tax=Desulfonema ishimotonii TaxID=45657 RepID=A0A401FTJ1_9BACT|nr:hypothetical protein [Desulfonema ishimotonii]GBC60273.1 hypothetical protein DENIS_1224 [Desulfonema ishimotonii]
MNTANHRLRTTLMFGLVCGLAFIPATMVLNRLIWPPMPFRLTLWGYFAVYGCFLIRWGKKSPVSLLFPLLLSGTVLVFAESRQSFLLIMLMLLSWLRSGVCFPSAPLKMLIAELLFSFGGGLLVAGFSPHSALTWALGIWLFFLIQSLYFLFFTENTRTRSNAEPDPFECARKAAERILEGRF